MRPEIFAVAWIALYAGHTVGDIWLQTDRQAVTKGSPGGRLACLRHVATLTLSLGLALGAAVAVTGIRPHLAAVLGALAVNAVTHYVADRRTPLAWLAELIGKGPFWRLGEPREGHDDNVTTGTGAFHMDQAFHVAWLFIAALIITI